MKSLRFPTSSPHKAWVLVDEEESFIEKQCLALMEGVDFPCHFYRVSFEYSWKFIPWWLTPNFMIKVAATPKPLRSPWPTFIICGGKAGLKVGAYLRKKQASFVVGVGASSSYFDQTVQIGDAPKEQGKKVVSFGPIHRLYPELLLQARKSIYRKIDHLPKPRIGLFLTGQDHPETLISSVHALHKRTSLSLMIWVEDPTQVSLHKLKKGFENLPHVLWEGKGENPYVGFLAHSDGIIVSSTSPLMVAEVSVVGKPFFIYQTDSLDSYMKALIQKGYASLLTEQSSILSRGTFSPPQEAFRIAQLLKERYMESLATSPLNLSSTSVSFKD